MSDACAAERHKIRRYIVVGLVNTIVGYGVYLAALQLIGNPNSAVATSTVLGYCFNFLTTGHFVFNQTKLSLVPRFVAAACIIYGLNALLLEQLLSLGFGPEMSQLLCIPFVIVGNYLLLKFVVYR